MIPNWNGPENALPSEVADALEQAGWDREDELERQKELSEEHTKKWLGDGVPIAPFGYSGIWPPKTIEQLEAAYRLGLDQEYYAKQKEQLTGENENDKKSLSVRS